MSHDVETMAYAGQTPWHGLGTRVSSNISVDEMLKEAGLDWSVTEHPAFATIGGKQVELPYKALVRDSDNKVLTVASKDWKPLQNKDALGFFRDYTRAGNIKLETAGSLKGGKLIWGLAVLNKHYEVTSGDRVNGYVLLASHHEYGKSTSVRTTSVRVVCNNTMTCALNQKGNSTYTQTHAREFDAEAAKMEIQEAVASFMYGEVTAKKLLTLKLTGLDTLRVLAPHFQKDVDNIRDLLKPANRNRPLEAVLKSISNAPGAVPGTGWGIQNGVTHWADHVAGRTSLGDDNRLANAWFGRTASIKQKVQEDLLKLAA